MGMKVLEDAGAKAGSLIDFGIDFKSFVNKHEGFILDLRQDIGKPLDTVTDDDLNTYFEIILDADQLVSARAFMEVAQDMIDTVKGIRDKLPANDIGT